MRIFVAGSSGQVAQALARAGAGRGLALALAGRPSFDLADAGRVSAAVSEFGPDIVINAAAYTAVDQAENEPEAAHAINAAGAGALAAAAAQAGAAMLHLSTDYVFDGTKDGPYLPDDPVAPLGVYGESKLAGERAVAAANPRHLIFRTAWVYSPYGKNFVRTMLRLAGDRDEVRVVADQLGSPTAALDIADGLLDVAAHVARTPDFAAWGVYHLAGSGTAAWADVAEETFAVSRAAGGPSASVTRITTAEFPTPARRPANSRLDTRRLEEVFGVRLPDWRQSVGDCVRELIQTNGATAT